MVAFSPLLTAVVAIAGSASVVSAEYLAITNTTPSWIGGCKGPGSSIARSNGSNGSRLEGCKAGGYTNGYTNGNRVYTTSYGANVHNNKGQHQRCETDKKQMRFFPVGYCINTIQRVLKFQGKWHPDA
ncbi:hypothetical protein B0T18DRAFT_393593 [Schizothecium vesticola]|uniref:Uncharacterized protein n=1 Tax=Schizothecium vesticola TaxID=314040 RepID=A0AA40JZX7_9PEZI|nr:hypothetical protein B0T18DRAFT_393593 [Schizothecium vesticola]